MQALARPRPAKARPGLPWPGQGRPGPAKAGRGCLARPGQALRWPGAARPRPGQDQKKTRKFAAEFVPKAAGQLPDELPSRPSDFFLFFSVFFLFFFLLIFSIG